MAFSGLLVHVAWAFGAIGVAVLVVGLIWSVTVSPTLRNVAVLGLIVLIRTFLSVSLEVEINGELPWRRGLTSGVTAVKAAASSSRPLAGNREERDIRS